MVTSGKKGKNMDQSLLVPLLIVLAIIIVWALFYRARKHRRHHSRNGHHAVKRFIGHKDHGKAVAKHHGHARSPLWARVAMEHRLIEPACVVCGYKGPKVQVHHIKPFHLHPLLELDPHNLITLCEAKGREHHLLIGHLDDWESYNEHIHEDVKRFRHKTEKQIRADLHWQKMVLQRPDPSKSLARH
jgi:5-methylcytosine-specific restriction endonuclease McrA